MDTTSSKTISVPLSSPGGGHLDILEEQSDPMFKVWGGKLQCHNPNSHIWAAIN